VAEFATLLGNEVGERTDDTRILVVETDGGLIGFIVDAVTEVMMVDADKIEDVTTIGSLDHDFIIGIIKLDENLVSLVDVTKLLTASDEEETPADLAA
jgi:purine-binding chemotaxis protein CheW